MIASITTKYRGATDRTGSRIVASARLKRDGSTTRVTVRWDHSLGVEDNHRQAAFAVLGKAGVIRGDYRLDGFSHDGVGTWVASDAIDRLIRRAETLLDDLLAQVQEGERDGMRDKYLDDVRDEADRVHDIVTFLKANL